MDPFWTSPKISSGTQEFPAELFEFSFVRPVRQDMVAPQRSFQQSWKSIILRPAAWTFPPVFRCADFLLSKFASVFRCAGFSLRWFFVAPIFRCADISADFTPPKVCPRVSLCQKRLGSPTEGGYFRPRKKTCVGGFRETMCSGEDSGRQRSAPASHFSLAM